MLKIIVLGIITVLFYRPLIAEAFFIAPHTIFQITIIILAFMLFVHKYMHPQEPLFICMFDKIFMSFLLFLLLSLFFSVNKEASISQIFYFATLYLWYWTISNLPAERPVEKLLRITLICSCLLAVGYAWYQYAIGFDQTRLFVAENSGYAPQSKEFIRRLNSDTVFSTFLYPPAFAGYLGVIFLVILGFIREPLCGLKEKNRLIIPLRTGGYIFLVSLIPMLILTRSKGAWAAFIIGLIYFAVLYGFKNKTGKLKSFFFLCMFIGAFFLIKNISSTHLPTVKNFLASFEVRYEYWKATIEMIKQRPVFGFGPGTFASVYPGFKTLLAEETTMAHNSFLQIWAEAGFAAFVLFVSFFAAVCASGYRFMKDSRAIHNIGIPAGIITFLIHNLTDFSLYVGQVSLIIFALIGMLVLGERLTNPAAGFQDKLFLKKEHAPARLVFAGIAFIISLFYLISTYSAIYYDKAAENIFKKKDFKTALLYGKKASALNPFSAGYCFHAAVIFEALAMQENTPGDIRREYFKKAIDRYEAAVSRDPLLPYYHYRFGKLLLLMSKDAPVYSGKARLELEKSAQLYPVNPFYHEQLSKFYGIINAHELSQSEGEKAVELKKYYHKGTR